MKFIKDTYLPTVELTHRNIKVLAALMDSDIEDKSIRLNGFDGVIVRVVEDSEHYADRRPGPIDPIGNITFD
jgi:hypothetical protein